MTTQLSQDTCSSFIKSTGSRRGSTDTNFMAAGTFFKIGNRSSAASLFSTLVPNQTCSHPLPQSGGKHCNIRSGLFVNICQENCGCFLMISQDHSRHSSASG